MFGFWRTRFKCENGVFVQYNQWDGLAITRVNVQIGRNCCETCYVDKFFIWFVVGWFYVTMEKIIIRRCQRFNLGWEATGQCTNGIGVF